MNATGLEMEVTEPQVEITTQEPLSEQEQPSEVVQQKKRGRPKVDVVWPDGQFTFNALTQQNVLSSSSLRKKMRVELIAGELVKVDTLKTAFGRPQNIYKKAL